MRVERRSPLSPLEVYRTLLTAYGPQNGLSAGSPFEVMVNIILAQGTSWKNNELALASLKEHHMMDCHHMAQADATELGEIIRSSGFFKQKARCLKEFSQFYIRYDTETGMKRWPASSLRTLMLQVHGIGPATADSILLHALDKPTFVVDTNANRLFSRIGTIDNKKSYNSAKQHLMNCLPRDLSLFKAFHALMIEHNKRHCQTKPDCQHCPLQAGCIKGQQFTQPNIELTTQQAQEATQ